MGLEAADSSPRNQAAALRVTLSLIRTPQTVSAPRAPLETFTTPPLFSTVGATGFHTVHQSPSKCSLCCSADLQTTCSFVAGLQDSFSVVFWFFLPSILS
ncbi:hypothetical protein CRENBAI_016035 [Crenichthys baileyi]|uniref:Uncharacterized protein n=1 Tax=Crenichthys baileyi TaxID=28760 RepID=A0AAV9RZX5_9TELE